MHVIQNNHVITTHIIDRYIIIKLELIYGNNIKGEKRKLRSLEQTNA